MWKVLRRWLERWGWVEPRREVEGFITSEEIERDLDRLLGTSCKRHVGWLTAEDMDVERQKRLNYSYTRTREVSVEEQTQRRDKVLEMDFTPPNNERQSRRRWLRGLFNRLY